MNWAAENIPPLLEFQFVKFGAFLFHSFAFIYVRAQGIQRPRIMEVRIYIRLPGLPEKRGKGPASN
jgi:hypothetical protein